MMLTKATLVDHICKANDMNRKQAVEAIQTVLEIMKSNQSAIHGGSRTQNFLHHSTPVTPKAVNIPCRVIGPLFPCFYVQFFCQSSRTASLLLPDSGTLYYHIAVTF